ncbi:MAG: sel1 repeat family protein, partial [Rhodospirillaceae bacterium]|nr:sel1 repeat family protein [Rhodospirillaceae bacterium]
DFSAALAKIKPLAESGHAEAQYNLGLMYVGGHGVARDDAEAAKWYGNAARQELTEAQYNLGLMYALGQGVKKNYILAHMWWTIAARQGHQGASKNREIAAAGMSRDQMAEAQKLAREWQPN